ncbi:helix-turn-helix domain-containing protein [Hymenobacter terrenus]|uniref:helix-turn-helix domain-containing protein n=1 Tax=Hymenobacter terrenus TaxID=1629124 RepID=UPI0012E06550|nr:hypothetical protein [Hymenobacter terrenus]
MSRRVSVSETVGARVRNYFGLSQAELARYLGVSEGFTGHLESGRRALPFKLGQMLDALARPIPATFPPLDTPPAPADLGPPEPAPLEARLDYCRHHARRLRRALRPLVAQAAYAARWRAALPTLRAALPPDPGGEEPPVHTGPGRWAAFLVWYRWRWLADRPTELPPSLSARYHLLRLQAEALEMEAAALEQLLERPAAGAVSEDTPAA